MIEFQLDATSGVATYLQLVQQVHQALQLGLLEPGDQLPTAQQVVAKLAINPNTVLQGLPRTRTRGPGAARPGVGTFIVAVAGPAPIRPRRPVPRVDDRLAAQGARRRAWARRHRSDLPHRVRDCFAEGET